MDTRHCRNCVYATMLQVAAQTVLVCANRSGRCGRLTCVRSDGTCGRFSRTCKRRGRPRGLRLPPPPPPNDDVRYISLTRGRFAIVDAADYDELNQYLWTWSPTKGGSGYATRFDGTRVVRMHRQITNAPKGMVVDHIDGNGLNNRRSNLRLCSQRENCYNQRPKRNRKQSVPFKGVYYRHDRPKPLASIKYEGKNVHLGAFDTEIAAAKAYDRKAVEFFGEFAYLNFPEDYGRPPRQAPTGKGLREKG